MYSGFRMRVNKKAIRARGRGPTFSLREPEQLPQRLEQRVVAASARAGLLAQRGDRAVQEPALEEAERLVDVLPIGVSELAIETRQEVLDDLLAAGVELAREALDSG